MVIFQVRPVIPTHEAKIVIMLIGAFGFVAQVCSSDLRSPLIAHLVWHSENVKTLLTKGLQLEAGGRGTLAIYTSVCPRKFAFPKRTSTLIALFLIGCLRCYVRVYHLPYHASCPLDRWNCHHHELRDLYHCTAHTSSALARAHSYVVDKKEGCYRAGHRTHSLTNGLGTR